MQKNDIPVKYKEIEIRKQNYLLNLEKITYTNNPEINFYRGYFSVHYISEYSVI